MPNKYRASYKILCKLIIVKNGAGPALSLKTRSFIIFIYTLLFDKFWRFASETNLK